jgi:hypothetical protein
MITPFIIHYPEAFVEARVLPPITSFMGGNPASINPCQLLTIQARIGDLMNADMKIAGKRTAKDWQEFRKTLVPGGDPKCWDNAFGLYFETRLSTRYLKPVETLRASKTTNGEGFSILAIHCSMIEFLESTLQGISYRFRRRTDPPLNNYEYSESGKVFIDFLSKRHPFSKVFDASLAEDFYRGVRCALLHEARTKDGWLVKAKGTDIAAVSHGQKIVYRNNFHEALLEFIDSYKSQLLSDRRLQEAFVRKFDSLCL